MIVWFLKPTISSIAQRICAYAYSLLYSELNEFAASLPKYVHLATVFGRVYALCIQNGVFKPEEHPKAYLVRIFPILCNEKRFVFTLWLVSFPKKKWNEIPQSKKIEF